MATELLPQTMQAVSQEPGLLSAQNQTTQNVAAPLYQNQAPEETVENRLNNLLKKDNPYLLNARSSAERQAASRGLQNSSIAAGAGESAAIQSALPIAQQDASFYQQRNLAGQQGEIQSYLSGQQANQQAGLYNVQGDISSRLQGEQGDISSRLQREQGDISSRLAQEEFQHQRYLNDMGYKNEATQKQLAFQYDKSLKEMGYSHDQLMKQMDIEWNKVDLNARMQVEYDRLTEDNKTRFDETSAQISQDYQKDMLEVMLNPNFKTTADRQAAINQLNYLTQQRMQIAGKIAGVELSWGAPESPYAPQIKAEETKAAQDKAREDTRTDLQKRIDKMRGVGVGG